MSPVEILDPCTFLQAALEPFNEWNEAAIERRQQGIAALARRAWSVQPL
jgi:hypothetical protein